VSPNPLLQIRKDLVRLAQLAIDAGIHNPHEMMQVASERQIRKLLKRYAIKTKQMPKFRATTK
jgi:hypothetical protein